MFLVLEVAMILLLILGFITQIVIPVVQDRPTFPMFRKETKLMEEARNTKQEIRELNLEGELNNLKAAVASKDSAVQNEKQETKGNTTKEEVL